MKNGDCFGRCRRARRRRLNGAIVRPERGLVAFFLPPTPAPSLDAGGGCRRRRRRRRRRGRRRQRATTIGRDVVPCPIDGPLNCGALNRRRRTWSGAALLSVLGRTGHESPVGLDACLISIDDCGRVNTPASTLDSPSSSSSSSSSSPSSSSFYFSSSPPPPPPPPPLSAHNRLRTSVIVFETVSDGYSRRKRT